MQIPVRCYSCGKVIAHYYNKFQEGVKAGKEPKDLLDSFELTRYCCRRMIIAHVEIMDSLMRFA